MGMPRLFVFRHAKSNWSNAYLADFDRALAPRGLRAAGVMAEHIAALDGPPALVLCSTARRAQDTLEPLRDRLPATTEVRLEDGLYGADAPDLLARLRQVPDDVASVMLVGHNPGFEDLVRRPRPGRRPGPDHPGPGQVPHRRAGHAGLRRAVEGSVPAPRPGWRPSWSRETSNEPP